MAEQCRLLIADTSEAVRESLREILAESFDLRTCCDGRTALELLHRFRPEVLVLDLMLPGIDGLSLLQTAVDAGICPAVLATTRQQNDYILDAAYRLGVSYIMIRPCEIGALVERIQDLSRSCSGKALPMDLSSQVKTILVRLGFPTKPRSYALLHDAILWMADHPGAFLSKELYPAIGKMHGISDLSAEKDIRVLIHTIWEHRDDRIWQLYFPPDAEGNIPRPTNGTFITRIVDRLPTQLERSANPDV